MKYIITLNNKRYEVEVEKGEAVLESVTDIPVFEQKAVSQPEPVKAAAVNAAPIAKPSETVSGEKITSPLPGTILSVKASKGQAVKKGDILVIIEAMKMENEVLSPRDGVVSEVYVSNGQTVSTDDLLIVLN